jgi:hypothetical protein
MATQASTAQLERFIRAYGDSERGRPLSLRSAMHHRTTDSQAWRDFMTTDSRGEACEIIPRAPTIRAVAGKVCVAPAAMSVAEDERTIEQQAEVSAWEGYVAAMHLQTESIKGADPVTAIAAVKLGLESHKLVCRTRADREQAEVAAGRLIPASEIQAMRSGLMRIADLINGMDSELCVAANPDNPQVAKAALRAWVDGKFAAMVRGAMDQLRENT